VNDWKTSIWVGLAIAALQGAALAVFVFSMLGALTGCSVSLAAGPFCYHGTFFDVRNGGWSQTCRDAELAAYHDPASPEALRAAENALGKAVEGAIRAFLIQSGAPAIAPALGAARGVLRGAPERTLPSPAATPGGAP
jgi:hypothetical protein